MNTHLLRSSIGGLLALSAAAAWASSDTGTTAGGFLKLGAGARAAGLGEACSALVDDATALYWNPAALNRLEGGSAVLMHAAHLESSAFDYGAWGLKLGESSALGLGAQYFSAGEVQETDKDGFQVGRFHPTDLAVSAGYAHALGPVSLGVGAKFVRSTLLKTASTPAFDVGLLSTALFGERYRVGLTASNLGGELDYGSRSSELPSSYRLGNAFQVSESWILALDAVMPKDNDTYFSLGSEHTLPLGETLSMALRLGYNTRSGADVDGMTGLTVGIGLGLDPLKFDYGLVPMGGLGVGHRLSVSYGFGESEPPSYRPPAPVRKSPAAPAKPAATPAPKPKAR